MLSKAVLTQREFSLSRQTRAIDCRAPVPPYIEKILAKLLERSHVYQYTVNFVEGTGQMEANVTRYTNASLRRRVMLCENEQTPEKRYGYSRDDCGLRCLQSISVLWEKYGSSNMDRFMYSRHLTTASKAIEEAVMFLLPDQCDINDVI